jgi:hypothetical protein
VINIINFTCNDNPPWPPGDSAGRPPRPAPPLDQAVAVVLSWLAFIPRRLGDYLFTMNDNEAYWRGWQITKTHGGLGRRYRDPLFDTLAECPACQGAGACASTGCASTACARCLGTGRVTIGEVS